MQLETLPTDMVVSSHRGIITKNIKAEWQNYSQQLDERSQRILELLATPKTIDELVEARPIYRKFPYQEVLLRYWEKIMIRFHLEELKAAGKVEQQGVVYFLQ